jgi:aquaporin related protein
MLAILLLAAEKHKATFIAPIGIGLALFVAELLGVYYTGGSLNPARSFGPAVVIKQFDGYRKYPYHYRHLNRYWPSDWIYWLGPALGATIAAGFYKLLKVLQYETVLGLEDGEEATPASQGDEENNITGAGNGGQKKNEGVDGGKPEMENEKLGKGVNKGGNQRQGSWKVSGPGLGDLHTAGEYNDVSPLSPETRQRLIG